MTDDQILADLCGQLKIGLRAVQGQGRDQATVAARREIVKALRQEGGWVVRRIAQAMKKSERAIGKMTQK